MTRRPRLQSAFCAAGLAAGVIVITLVELGPSPLARKLLHAAFALLAVLAVAWAERRSQQNHIEGRRRPSSLRLVNPASARAGAQPEVYASK